MQTVCRASGGYSERLRFSLVHVHPRYRGTPPPNPSSRHLSYRTSPCPSVGPSANWAITGSLTSSCGCFKQLLRSSRRNVSPVELIDGPFLMGHEYLTGALVERRESAKTSARSNGVLHHAPEAFDRIKMMPTMGR